MPDLPNPDEIRRRAPTSRCKLSQRITDDDAFDYLEWSFALFYGPYVSKIEGN